MLSICIIVKNDEKRIEKCLSSIRNSGFSGEITVVDTGSTDGTVEVCKKYTDSILSFEWINDFAKAKNHAIQNATNPYVLVLDSDEYIESFDINKVYSYIRTNPDAVFRIKRNNYFTRKGMKNIGTEWINRLFSREQFHYEGRIHEQVCALDGRAYDTYEVPITIGHTGYDLTDEEAAEKAARNIKLLQEELSRLLGEDPSGDQVPYIYYQLGKSYYLIKDYNKASEEFAKGLSFDLNPKLEYVIDMVETYGYSLINSNNAKEALLFEGIYNEFSGNSDFHFLMGLIYMNNALFDRAIEEFKTATTFKTARIAGTNSYSANYNIGVIYECLGNVTEAKKYYGKCGDYEPARERISRINDASV